MAIQPHMVCKIGLNGQCHEIFDFRFFYELVSPKTLSVLLGPFRFFRKFLEVFAAQGAPAVPVAKFAAGVVYTGGYTGVVDTGGAPSPRIKFEITLMLFWGLGEDDS